MGSKGDGYDNAVAESFFATLKSGPMPAARAAWPKSSETYGVDSTGRCNTLM